MKIADHIRIPYTPQDNLLIKCGVSHIYVKIYKYVSGHYNVAYHGPSALNDILTRVYGDNFNNAIIRIYGEPPRVVGNTLPYTFDPNIISNLFHDMESRGVIITVL